MCTVTIAPGCRAGSGSSPEHNPRLRMACNRDELRIRPSALPPRVHSINGVRAVMPIDAAAGGTWIAANECGLAMTLLNVNSGANFPPSPLARTKPPTNRESRGHIIPALVDCRSLDQAVQRAMQMSPTRFEPCRLVIADVDRVVEIRIEAGRIAATEPVELREPVMFASSGLGDAVVDPPRRELFAQFVARGPQADWQDQFHRHSWPDRPQLSVCMRRDEACTVSCTTVEIGDEAVRMIYHPAAPDEPAQLSEITMPRNSSLAGKAL